MHIFHHDFMRKHYYFIHMKIQIKCNFFINQNLFGINVSLQKSLFVFLDFAGRTKFSKSHIIKIEWLNISPQLLQTSQLSSHYATR